MTEWTILPLSTDFALCKGESMEAILHSRTLAEHVAACLNACTGMADPAAEIAELRDDRAQLVETLEAIARGDYIVTADSHDAASDTLERLADAEKMRRIRRE